MNGWLESDSQGGYTGHSFGGWSRTSLRLLTACMLLLAAAAGWLVLTRPVHRIEGDFLEREDRGAFDGWLTDQLKAPVAETRARACVALSRILGAQALDHLVLATRDPAPSVRAAAAFAIGSVLDLRLGGGPPPAMAATALHMLLDDEERLVAARAVEALGKLGGTTTAEDLTRTAAPVATTMTALMRIGTLDATQFVSEYLDSDDQDSRWAAALAAHRLGIVLEPTVWARLQPLVSDDNSFVRAAALRAVGTGVADNELLAQVRTNLDHADPKVRFEARLALASLSGEPATPDLPAGEPHLALESIPPLDNPRLNPGDYQRLARTLGVRMRLRTSLGDFEIELDYEGAPLTSEHFRSTAAAGKLNGLQFARVRPNGYAVTAAPLGPVRSELNPNPFLRGSLGLLRQGASSGGGFFLCLTPLPLADGRYVNFGRVAAGDRLLDGITPGATLVEVSEIR